MAQAAIRRRDEPKLSGFLHAVKMNDRHTLKSVYGSEYQTQSNTVSKATMGEASGQIGGYLVPTDFTTQILGAVAENSIIYRRANVIPMGSRETQCPYVNAETAQSAGTSPFFGGVKFTWGSEPAPLGATNPTFRQMSLVAWDLLGYATVSNQWLMDAGEQGDAYLIDLLGKAAAWYADYAFFNGTGIADSMPLGILNATGAKSVSRAGANSINIVDIATMAGSLMPASWSTAIWACSPGAILKIAQIASEALESSHDLNSGASGSLLTRPLYVTEKLPALGTRGDIILIDPMMYAVGVRQEVLIEASTLGPTFRTNQTDFRVWLRMDGKPQFSSTITLQDGATTVSPFVVLAA